MTIVCVDIDGTIVKRCHSAYIAACNRYPNLGIPEPELLPMRHLEEFLASVHWQEYVAREPQAMFRYDCLSHHPAVLQHDIPLKSAREGCVKLRTAAQNLYYYTCRYTKNVRWNTDMQRVTIEWLQRQGFPEPQQVVFCKDYQDKMLELAILAMRERQAVYHIDDSWLSLYPYLDSMPEQFQLVAFRPQRDTELLCMRDWLEVDQLIGKFGEDNNCEV